MNRLLVVVDMQNDFVDGALGTKEAAAIVPHVIEKIKTFNGQVVFTRDTHDEGYLETQEGRKLPIPHCIAGTIGWQLQPEIEALRKELGSPVFDKNTFGSKGLCEYLEILDKQMKIDEITFIGLCTDICVISNALLVKAFFPEISIVVEENCCAGVTVESHNNALKAMKVCQVTVQ